MKHLFFTLTLAVLTLAGLSTTTVNAGSLGQNQAPAVKQLKVRSAAEVKQAFGFAAHQRQQQVDITCSPASSEWCADGFIQACKKAKGGMSTNPDGSVTCSLPQHD